MTRTLECGRFTDGARAARVTTRPSGGPSLKIAERWNRVAS